MRNWKRIFQSGAGSGLYTVSGTKELARVTQAAEASGLTVIRIDLAGVGDKPGLLKATAESLHFPEYFGMNWDALEECLTDLSWLPAKGHVLYFSGVSKFFEAAPKEMLTFRHILEVAATYWKGKTAQFYVLMNG